MMCCSFLELWVHNHLFILLLQVHLEASITRHKAHIMKLELILRLLDNDELSPEEVNDVKELLEDYVERNQVVSPAISFHNHVVLYVCIVLSLSLFF